MVIPLSFSSGALSISSNLVAFALPSCANTAVIAAVVVVLPWSTCPMVPMFTWGFVRSNFSFAISFASLGYMLKIAICNSILLDLNFSVN